MSPPDCMRCDGYREVYWSVDKQPAFMYRGRRMRWHSAWVPCTRTFEKPPDELWYNSNCWGQPKESGWGTWAFRAGKLEAWCGVAEESVYIQQTFAPYLCSRCP